MNYTHFTGLDGFVWFIGVVEDNNDPDKLGRVKVRAYGHHTNDLSNIPLEYLPWATVMAPTNDTSMQGVGDFSTIKPGTWVVGFFLDAEEKQQPVVMGTLFIFTLLGLITKLITDIMYVYVDPRIKFSSSDTSNSLTPCVFLPVTLIELLSFS